ncbi:MAG TPA: ABC transporter permease, partial [Anaerolineales bacterium]|nr:ABC transporter permease [Anaerolineales bacterium]
MRPRWRKVFHDLWDNFMRTALVVLSIAVGVFSIGVITGAYEIISNDMGESYAANNPANIELRMTNFNDDVLSSIRNFKGVQDAEGRRVINYRVHPEGSTQWSTIDLIAVEDFSKNNVNLLVPILGKAEAGKDEIVLNKKNMDKVHVTVGDYLVFELADGTTKKLKVVGVVQDSSTGADDFLAPPFAFTVMDTLETLQQPDLFNRAYLTVSESPNDLTYIRTLGADLKDKLEKNGNTVIRTRYSERNKHPMTDTINAVLYILMALGVLIVFLSSSLIANTLSALLSQHLRHIGIIKLVGGRNRQVFA